MAGSERAFAPNDTFANGTMPSRTPPNGTSRELGEISTIVSELRHDVRNFRTIIGAIDDRQREQERRMSELAAEIAQFRARVMTGIAVGAAILSCGAWILELWMGA